MNPKDIRSTADVVRWLRHYVEWSDESSRDMALRAIDVLTADGFPAPHHDEDRELAERRRLLGAERARVVAYLRREAVVRGDVAGGSAVELLSLRIEQGAHLEDR